MATAPQNPQLVRPPRAGTRADAFGVDARIRIISQALPIISAFESPGATSFVTAAKKVLRDLSAMNAIRVEAKRSFDQTPLAEARRMGDAFAAEVRPTGWMSHSDREVAVANARNKPVETALKAAVENVSTKFSDAMKAAVATCLNDVQAQAVAQKQLQRGAARTAAESVDPEDRALAADMRPELQGLGVSGMYDSYYQLVELLNAQPDDAELLRQELVFVIATTPLLLLASTAPAPKWTPNRSGPQTNDATRAREMLSVFARRRQMRSAPAVRCSLEVVDAEAAVFRAINGTDVAALSADQFERTYMKGPIRLSDFTPAEDAIRRAIGRTDPPVFRAFEAPELAALTKKVTK